MQLTISEGDSRNEEDVAPQVDRRVCARLIIHISMQSTSTTTINARGDFIAWRSNPISLSNSFHRSNRDASDSKHSTHGRKCRPDAVSILRE
jgi:hypothetical protein